MRYCILVFGLALVVSAQISTQPVLRIEAGYHSGTIMSLDGDAADRFLVSGSEDKTVRLWDAHTGELIRVFRPPIGPDNDGKIYAVAISPDGNTIAAAGWTGSVADKFSIYFFDRETGRLTKRIGGLPEVIPRLRYSPDGRFLLAGLAEKNGIRLYRTADYSEIAEDTEYGDQAGGDFAPNGISIVTSSIDGAVRLYRLTAEGSLRLERRLDFPQGMRPSEARFSPDGSRIAVSLLNTPDVVVLRSADLTTICSPDTVGIKGNLWRVAWSPDGASLFAGGVHPLDNRHPVVRWSAGGCGARSELPGPRGGRIVGLRSMRDGSVAFAGNYPQIGILNARGERALLWGREDPTSILHSTDLMLSADAGTVCEPRKDADEPNCFSLADRRLTTIADPAAAGLLAPDTTGLKITDWENSAAPKLNGKPLPIGPDRSRYLAVSPNRRSFIIATEFRLFAFDNSGRKKWVRELPDLPGAVNISRDGRIAVVILADATIRWYAMDSGKELMTFFGGQAHLNNWILSSPSGYYDAGPGGEDRMGWSITTSRDAASDFYPASRFRSTFYRPDVLAKVLKTGDVSEALRLADAAAGRSPNQITVAQALPPVVTLLAPGDLSGFSANEVTLTYTVRTPSGEPVTRVRALVDGRPLTGMKRIVPLAGAGSAIELKVPVPQGDCTVSLIAENRFAASEPASVRLRWRGGASPAALKPRLFVLAIGVSAYPSPNSLRFAGKDAKDIAALMELQRGRLYGDVQVRLLTDRQATRDAIVDGFDWLEKSVSPSDTALVLLSGHGVNDTHDNYYFLPVNFDENALKRTAISFSEIRETMQSVAGKVVLFVDSCHSGNVLGGKRDPNAVVNELSSPESGVVVFAASTGNQVALEREGLGNGIFTKAILEGIGGAADYQHKGAITVFLLSDYISNRVKELTQDNQTPTMAIPRTIANFTLASLR